MNEEEIKQGIIDILKQHKKKPEDITTETEAAVMAYFTDDKMDELAKGLVEILKQHANKAE